MFEAIVTLVYPAADSEPAHTKVYRIEFDSAQAMEKWLDTSETEGVVDEQQMGR
jgi:hypothetical protein